MPPEAAREAVSVTRARDHVLFTLARTFGATEAQLEVVAATAEDPSHGPYAVYDLEGPMLFYLFPARIPGENGESWVRAAADPIVGPAVMAVDTPRTPWNPAASLEQAAALAQEMFAEPPGLPQLICYSYPLIGVRVPLQNSGRSVIFDAESLDLVPVERELGENQFGARSYLRTVLNRQAKKRQEIWAADDAALARRLTQLGVPSLTAKTAAQPDPTAPGVQSRILQYSTLCPSHDCFALYSQTRQVFCAVASAQMIMAFYRYDFNQPRIAQEMGASSSGMTLTSIAAQLAAFQSLSKQGLAATVDLKPTWIKARNEINRNRPVRSGIEGHARVCSGWLEEPATATQQPQLWLRLYDPWPPNPDHCVGGKTTWEKWTAVTHTDFIFVRHA